MFIRSNNGRILVNMNLCSSIRIRRDISVAVDGKDRPERRECAIVADVGGDEVYLAIYNNKEDAEGAMNMIVNYNNSPYRSDKNGYFELAENRNNDFVFELPSQAYMDCLNKLDKEHEDD